MKWPVPLHLDGDFSFFLYLSFVCYSLYHAVIVRARSSRMEGSRQLVVVLLIVF